MTEIMTHLDFGQRQALELMLTGGNVFLTGKAGTGKSTVLKLFKEHAPEGTVFLAPTGLAAVSIEGSTIHRFFGLHAGILPPNYMPEMEPERQELISMARTIVIDEISMVRADVFAAMDSILRSLAPPDCQNRAFGGKQIIVVGDFFQLPPVVTTVDEERQLEQNFGGILAFQTRAWELAYFETAALRFPHRHAMDAEYLDVLDALRRGVLDQSGKTLDACIAWLNCRVRVSEPPQGVTSLCTRKNSAAAINYVQDAMIPNSVVVANAAIQGRFDRDMYPAEERLEYRIGSRVMMLKNTPSVCGYEFVNGDTGTVVDIHPDGSAVEVALDSRRRVTVSAQTWLNCEYAVSVDPATGRHCVGQKVVGTFTQVPFMLAYAVTVHKAQGITLDKAHINLGRGTFAYGQLYTALSRCRSLAGLSMDRWVHLQDVMVDPVVAGFHGWLEYQEFGFAMSPDRSL
jgi:ABC-type cobalamin/Fe3+-siderophores transport system ATPase subunit